MVRRISVPPLSGWPTVALNPMQLTEARRAELVTFYMKNKRDAELTASAFNVHVSTVKRWVDRKKHGSNLANKPHHHHRRALSSDQVRYVRRVAKKRTTGVVTVRVNEKRAAEALPPVHERTVRRAITSGRQPLKALKRLKVKPVSATNMVKRVAYCKSRAIKEFSNRLYADSKTFSYATYKIGAGQVQYQDPGNRLTLGSCKGDNIAHAYAAVGVGYKSRLYFTQPKTKPQIARNKGIAVSEVKEKTFSSEHFIEVIPKMDKDYKKANPGKRHIWVLDQASQHDSDQTQRALKRLRLNRDTNFPPSSHDLNPIENFWSMVEHQLRNMPLGTPAQWPSTLQKAASKVPQADIDHAVQALPKRGEKVVALKGARLPSTHT